MTEDKSIQVLEVVADFLNAMEAATVNAKRQIADIMGVTFHPVSTKLPFDATKIKWQDRENQNGEFQMSEDYDSLDHKALLKFLEGHVPSKCITSEGWFYWVYPNGSTIGRKLKK
jgi:hypothetical protein